jgi:glycosyltransferase involved in cell wall biosynthesis
MGEKYSALMSVYKNDNEEYLKLAIESMLKQTIPPEQFVIVLDGEVPNETEKVINEYLNNHPNVFTLVKLRNNSGLATALNEGMNYCRNELIARMDADDISLPKRCERELERFTQNPKLDICGCNINEFYSEPENVKTVRAVPESYEEIRKFMRKRQPFNHPTIMYRKSKVIGVGGYRRLKRKEDFDLFSRMLSNGCYAENINESLYLYRANEDNYARRKSWQNFKSAVYVYWLHLKRKGCSWLDFIVMCIGELVFLIVPRKIMRKMSDSLLREKIS